VKALAYVRVSQEDESPENQIAKIKEWAEKNGVEIVSFYIDKDVSGSVPPRQRQQYNAMLNAARTLGIKLLLFYDLSRLSRSLEDGLTELKQLSEEGVENEQNYESSLSRLSGMPSLSLKMSKTMRLRMLRACDVRSSLKMSKTMRVPSPDYPVCHRYR